jgi:hypothetical protein
MGQHTERWASTPSTTSPPAHGYSLWVRLPDLLNLPELPRPQTIRRVVLLQSVGVPGEARPIITAAPPSSGIPNLPKAGEPLLGEAECGSGKGRGGVVVAEADEGDESNEG